MTRVPAAELHVHLEGTARPALVREIAARNGLDVPEGLFAGPDTFAWDDFAGFLRAYDLAASVIRTAEDYRDITYAYLSECAAGGCLYVELIASPDHARAVGLAEAEHRRGVFAGIDDARAEHGIEARVVVSVVRHLGVAAAERTVAEAVAMPHPYVVGIDLAGDEAAAPAGDFAEVFAAAHAAGLGCACHAGEHAGPASVRAALALPGVTRLSHGVRAVEDPGLVAELAERRTVLAICPSSNVALGVAPSHAAHPLRALREAGVRVCLGSDDPPYFATTIRREYDLAAEWHRLDEVALLDCTRTAIEASFAEAALKERLLAQLPAAQPQADAGVTGV